MKKKLLLSFLLNILIISAYSQPSWQWARSSSGSFKNDGGRCIAVDENGNSYVAGYFSVRQ
ncbi:MAG: SBBP repeat-containing protein [Bacteroidetes bacterium]|nr:SBBP repeat-containing protein [Bacteroidota bacterium]